MSDLLKYEKKIHKIEIEESLSNKERNNLDVLKNEIDIDNNNIGSKDKMELDELNTEKNNIIIDYFKNKNDINQNDENIKYINKKENKLKYLLETSYSKKNKKEIDFIPYNNNLSFLNDDFSLNTSKNEKSNDIINSKKDDSNLRKILEEKNEIFEDQYNNRKYFNFFIKVIYKNKKEEIECPLLLKDNELYILNPNNILNETLFYNSHNKDLINKDNKNDDENEDEDNKILKEENIFISLQKRYNFSKPLFYINFDLLTCKLLINKKTNWIKILILGCKKSLNILILDNDNFNRFIYLVNERIFNSEGNKNNLIELSLRKKPTFINNNFISIKEFESIAKTGDFIIFKSKFCGSRCQRVFTRDTYDHIALIENKNGEISLYQSSKNGDTNFLFWDYIIENSLYLYFDLITYRRLNFEADNDDELKRKQNEIENKFDDFSKDTIFKKYFLSFKNLLFCNGNKQERKGKRDWSKIKGFSCSSLATAFYIEIGAIKYNRNIHSVKPGDFQSNKNTLTFNDKFSFGPEKIIDFSVY